MSDELDRYYAMHGHDGREGKHAHHVAQRHTGTYDHANIEVISWSELQSRYSKSEESTNGSVQITTATGTA